MFSLLAIGATFLGAGFALFTGVPFFSYMFWVVGTATALTLGLKAYAYYLKWFAEPKKVVRDITLKKYAEAMDNVKKELNNMPFNKNAKSIVKNKKLSAFATKEEHSNIDYKTINTNYSARCTYCGRPLTAHKSVELGAGTSCLSKMNADEQVIINNWEKLQEKVLDKNSESLVVEYCNRITQLANHMNSYDLKNALFRLKVNLINKINAKENELSKSEKIGEIETQIWQKDSSALKKVPTKLSTF